MKKLTRAEKLAIGLRARTILRRPGVWIQGAWNIREFVTIRGKHTRVTCMCLEGAFVQAARDVLPQKRLVELNLRSSTIEPLDADPKGLKSFVLRYVTEREERYPDIQPDAKGRVFINGRAFDFAPYMFNDNAATRKADVLRVVDAYVEAHS